MSLRSKLLVSKLGLAILPVSLTAVVLLWRTNDGSREALRVTEQAFESNAVRGREVLVERALADQTRIARDIHASCEIPQELLQQKVASDLNVARSCLQKSGGLRPGSDQKTWNAVDQVSGKAIRVQLPELMVGATPLGQNTNMSVPSPVVDEVRQLVASNCTVFQRMNEAGDMLRICTNVQKADGSRAISTYIAAVSAEGVPSPIVSTVLKGETFVGRALVVDKWCVSAYEPVLDEHKKVIGMLFVGVPEQSANTLRQGLTSMRIGKSGFVHVINATGATRGKLIISKDGKRDGENVWDLRDSQGKAFIQESCRIAQGLKPGEIGEIRYEWKEPQDIQPRNMIVKLAYFAPWDWVIGVGAYEDEIYEAVRSMEQQAQAAVGTIRSAQARASFSAKSWSLGIALGSALLAAIVALWVTRTISQPLNLAISGLTEGASQVNSAAGQVAGASKQLADGASEQASALQETSAALEEVSAKARESAAFAAKADNLAENARGTAERGGSTMAELNQAMDGINEASQKVSKIIKVIEEIAFQTNLLALNAAVEAARAGEHGKGFAVVAEEVRGLAQRVAQAARETTDLIETAVTRARQGDAVAGEAAQALNTIIADVAQVSQLLKSINTGAQEQAHGVEQVSQAVTSMDKVTQANAAGAEESAAAAEQLSTQASAMLDYVDGLALLIGKRKN